METQQRDAEEAARALRLRLHVLRPSTDPEIDAAFRTIAQRPALPRASTISTSSLDDSTPSLFERFHAETHRYTAALQTALYDFAEQDRVVLIRRAGPWLLRGVPRALRVRVIAPFDLRVKRLGKQQLAGPMGETTNPRTVHDMARRDDMEKLKRMRYMYEVDLRDAALYDLVTNTEKLSIDAAVELVCSVLQWPEMAPTPAGQQLVADRALASRVQIAPRDASRDAPVPPHGRSPERRGHARGHGGHGGGGGRGAWRRRRRAGREDPAGGYPAHPAICRIGPGPWPHTGGATILSLDYTAVGQTTHLAARMEQLAVPGNPSDGGDGASAAGAVWAGVSLFRPIAGQSSRKASGNSHAEG